MTEVDLHWSVYGPREGRYDEAMEEVWDTALDALIEAQEQGKRYVLFTHPRQTDGPGEPDARKKRVFG